MFFFVNFKKRSLGAIHRDDEEPASNKHHHTRGRSTHRGHSAQHVALARRLLLLRLLANMLLLRRAQVHDRESLGEEGFLKGSTTNTQINPSYKKTRAHPFEFSPPTDLYSFYY